MALQILPDLIADSRDCPQQGVVRLSNFIAVEFDNAGKPAMNLNRKAKGGVQTFRRCDLGSRRSCSRDIVHPSRLGGVPNETRKPLLPREPHRTARLKKWRSFVGYMPCAEAPEHRIAMLRYPQNPCLPAKTRTDSAKQ